MIHRRSGFTLTELLLALSISGLIGVTVVLLLSSIARGTSRQTDSRRGAIARRVAIDRLAPLMRGAGEVMDVSSSALALWVADRNADAAPQLSETRLVRWDSAGRRVLIAEASGTLAPGDDTIVAHAGAATALEAIAGSGLYPERVLVENASSWGVDADEPDPIFAVVLRVRLTLETAIGAEPVEVVAALRGVD